MFYCCVCKECGAFLDSLLCIILMLSGTSSLVFVCVCVCVCVFGGWGGKINHISQQPLWTVCLLDRLCIVVVVISDLFFKKFTILLFFCFLVLF